MAHAHSRTLLAKMGFGDQDLKLPEHDVACQYIMTPDVFPKVFAEAMKLRPAHGHLVHRVSEYRGAEFTSEKMLTKGSGNYLTTVGFVDVYAKAYYAGEYWFDGRWTRLESDYGRTDGTTCEIGIEVKIQRETIASILRQIAVYREFGGFSWRWVLATRYAINESDLSQLTQERIAHVWLGDKFTRYLAEQKDQASIFLPSSSQEI